MSASKEAVTAGAATGHPGVTEAACEVLKAGGNAFDAAVAAGFAAAVAEPALTSLGGGGFLLARTADGRTVLFDFFVDTPGRGLNPAGLEPHFVPITVHFPASDQIFNVGLGSVAVPGNLRGFLHVHRRLGRLPLRDVLAPAIQLAREGLFLNAHQRYFLNLLHPIMTLTPAARALFAQDGASWETGDHFTNPDLAAFLETLPSTGDREFYEGELARRIIQDMREGQGLLTETDLAGYAVKEREPLSVGYRRWRLLTNPPPAWGGSLIALSLRLLEGCEVNAMEFNSFDHLHLLVTLMEEVDRLRAGGCLSPHDLTADGLASSLQRLRTASGGTTHVSVCDAEGNAASMTTSNGEGSGYLAPGTGIMLNNMMGEDDLHPDGFHASPPGIRVASMMAPSLVLEDERLQLVIGSGGSKRIRTAMLQVISAVLDFDKSVKTAIESPRLHWDGACVQAEPGLQETVLAALRQRWTVNVWPVSDVYFGGVQAVSPTGESAGDPRRGGSAQVLDSRARK